MGEFQKFFVSQVGILIRDSKCLILEFSKSPGKWGLPGGRVDEGEGKEEAFRREIKEELGIDEFQIHNTVDYDLFYVRPSKTVCGIVSYIENSSSEIILSDEHKSFAWVTEDELDNYNFIWPTLSNMIKKGFEYNEKNKIKKAQ
ncbi:hypothetical protein C0584_04495 [Candidatus Parcubacteria bacterium]|nr:MAG: hypothetical protein C0584_04495 [Candidatus Parcubacteria bacterium]